jgi:hypothetical protein
MSSIVFARRKTAENSVVYLKDISTRCIFYPPPYPMNLHLKVRRKAAAYSEVFPRILTNSFSNLMMGGGGVLQFGSSKNPSCLLPRIQSHKLKLKRKLTDLSL